MLKITEEMKMKLPSKNQCELARMLTKSKAPDEQICKELLSVPNEKWNECCGRLDSALRLHNKPFDKGWNILCEDFRNIAVELFVDSATLYVVYMDWLSNKNRE